MWGVEKYIEKCARSLFESTLEDIEFIFVDDYTPDKSVEVLERVMTDYPKRVQQISIVHHKANKGLPQARKTGFEASHGEFITYCDSDDWVAPTMYSKMLEKAALGGYDLVCCDFVYLSDNEVLWKPTYDTNKTAEELRKDLIACRVSNAVWNKIVHRSVYENNGIYFPTYSMDEDDVLTCQWAYYSRRPGYLHKCLYFHYANPDSMTHAKSKEKIQKGLRERLSNRKWIVSFLESKEDFSLSEAINQYKITVKLANSELTNRHSREIYPEVNKYMLTSSNYSIMSRCKYFVYLYCYPIYPIVKNILKR